MGSSNEAGEDIPFLIYTNSLSDYRVTVRSAGVDDSADAVIDQLARCCEPQLGDVAFGFAAVAPQPARSDGYWAVRGFDCGTFMGRDHTLGLVAVWIATECSASHAAWRCLHAQAPPIPGAGSYQLSPPGSALPPVIGAVAALRQWEETHGPTPPAEVLCWDQSGRLIEPCAPEGSKGRTPEPACPWTKLKTIVVAVGFAATALCALGLIRWMMAPTTPDLPKNPSPPLPQNDVDEIRQLLTYFIPQSEVATFRKDQLVEDVLQFEVPVRHCCNRLFDDLNDPGRRKEPAADLQGFLSKQRTTWQQDPIEPEPRSSDFVVTEGFKESIKILREFQNVRDLMDQLIDKDVPDDQPFRDHLQQLRDCLDRVRSSGPKG